MNPVDWLVEVLGGRMLAAHEAARNRPRTWNDLLEFMASNDDAILAPHVLLSIHMDREEISRLSHGSAADRKRAALKRRMLIEQLTAYATPSALRPKRRGKRPQLPPEAKRLRAALRRAKLEQARALAELAFLRHGEKKAVAFARFATELGGVAPKPDATFTSRAAQRAEGRARKKAGEPPRPRGRPARPR